jgi:hypothetical protein
MQRPGSMQRVQKAGHARATHRPLAGARTNGCLPVTAALPPLVGGKGVSSVDDLEQEHDREDDEDHRTAMDAKAMDAKALDSNAAAATGTTMEGTKAAESTGVAVTTTVVAVAATEDSACAARNTVSAATYSARPTRGRCAWADYALAGGTGADQPAMRRDSVTLVMLWSRRAGRQSAAQLAEVVEAALACMRVGTPAVDARAAPRGRWCASSWPAGGARSTWAAGQGRLPHLRPRPSECLNAKCAQVLEIN